MFSRLLVTAFIFSSAIANASSQVEIFRWKASGRFDLTATVERAKVSFSGDLREVDDSVEVTEDRFTARLTSYHGFVSVIITQLGKDDGMLFLLERKNKDFEQMNVAPIIGRASEMAHDLSYSLERFAALKKLNGKEPSFAFRTMVSYFEDNPGRKLDAFADDVEKGVDVVKVVPKPDSKVAERGGPDIRPPRNQPGEPGTLEDGAPAPAPNPRRRTPPPVGEPGWAQPEMAPQFDDGRPQQPRPRRAQPRDPQMDPRYAPPAPRYVQPDPRYAQPDPRYAPAPRGQNELPSWAQEQQIQNQQRRRPVQQVQPQAQQAPPPAQRRRMNERDVYLNGGVPPSGQYAQPQPQQAPRQWTPFDLFR